MKSRAALLHALAFALALGARTTTARAEGATAGDARPPRETAGSIAGRVVAEAMMGTSLASVGFLVGPKIATGACTMCMSAAGFAGADALFPLGVAWGGSLVRGHGSFLLTVAAPWAVSATAFVALARDKDYDGQPARDIGLFGGLVAAPISIVVYEVTHALSRATTAAAGLPPLQLAVSPRGDAVMGVVTFRE